MTKQLCTGSVLITLTAYVGGKKKLFLHVKFSKTYTVGLVLKQSWSTDNELQTTATLDEPMPGVNVQVQNTFLPNTK